MKTTMKKKIAVITAAIAAIAIVGGTVAVAASPKLPDIKEIPQAEASFTEGGWMIPADTKANIPADALAAFDKAVDNNLGVNFRPLAYLGSQVTSGTNYKFLCEATIVYPASQPELMVVTVYQDLQGNAEITNVSDFNLIELTQENEAAAGQTSDDQTLCGGWTVNEETKSVLPSDIQKAFETATDGLTGATYDPIAILGTQVVAGQNTALLCRVTPTTPNAQPHLAVVTIYTPIEGAATVLNIADLDIAAY